MRSVITVSASDLIDIMMATTNYPRLHYFEFACAISSVSERALSALAGTAVQSAPNIHGTYESEAKRGDMGDAT